MAAKLSFLLICVFFTQHPSAPQPVPYPQSPVIRQVKFEWSTHLRLGAGSDNWPVTSAADDNQYLGWGDGGGFGGTKSIVPSGIGVARIEGIHLSGTSLTSGLAMTGKHFHYPLQGGKRTTPSMAFAVNS